MLHQVVFPVDYGFFICDQDDTIPPVKLPYLTGRHKLAPRDIDIGIQVVRGFPKCVVADRSL